MNLGADDLLLHVVERKQLNVVVPGLNRAFKVDLDDHQILAIARFVIVNDVLLVGVVEVASLFFSDQSSDNGTRLIVDIPSFVRERLVEVDEDLRLVVECLVEPEVKGIVDLGLLVLVFWVQFDDKRGFLDRDIGLHEGFSQHGGAVWAEYLERKVRGDSLVAWVLDIGDVELICLCCIY